MISCAVYEQPSLRRSHGLSCRVSGLGSSIQFLHRLPLLRSSSVSLRPLCSHSSNTLIGEMAHGDDCGKRPHDESSSRPHLPDVNGIRRSLGERGEEVSVWLSFAIGECIYRCIADLFTFALGRPLPLLLLALPRWCLRQRQLRRCRSCSSRERRSLCGGSKPSP
jgi:hypothetical protein